MTDSGQGPRPPLPLHDLVEEMRQGPIRSRAKNEGLEEELTRVLGAPVAVKATSEINKNLDNRVSEMARRAPRVGIVIVEGETESAALADSKIRNLMNWRLPEAYVVVERVEGRWRASRAYVSPSAQELEPRIRDAFPGVRVAAIQPGSVSGASPRAEAAPPTSPLALIELPFDPATTVDKRTLRMLRLSVASASAVMLVGPPGTGKTRLVDWVLNEAMKDPGSFGFSAAPKEPVRVTPEESWTTRDLVGGLTVDSGELRFRAGHVLRSIQEDRWLILDEANRADMDKIFGGLLTWLSSDQDVDLGASSAQANAPQVAIGWVSGPKSETTGTEALTGTPVEGPIAFRAGRDWRMLGTYNTLDAQRVFRFGHALSRRFARVPVPALEPERFQLALQAACDELGLSATVATTLAGLYSAHYAEPTTRLGHGVFLVNPPAYIAKGVKVSAPLPELIAEAYLVAVGTWLAAWEDDVVAGLRERIVNGAHLALDQWEWVIERLGTMR